MINKEVFELTEEGLQKLKDELETLKTVDRPRNIEAIKEARAQGDLSENADYDAARDEQRRIEARILEIENILKNTKIIKKDTKSDKVATGKKVTLKFLEINSVKTYEIVGTIEANPFQGRISNDSPLGKGILGLGVGETAIITTEAGKELSIQILTIE